MPYLVLGIALLAGFLLAGQWYVNADPKSILRVLKWLLVGLVLAAAAFFVATGKFLLAVAAIPALIPWLVRIRMAANAARAFHRMAGGGAGGGNRGGGPRSASGAMSRAEALDVLGLKEGATPDDIRDAHRRLIANLHPDKGGSDYLAAQINQAKDVLLG